MGIFTGATSSSDGTSGYVPAPTAGMQDDYYLCGNGEWVEYDPTPKTWTTISSKTFNGNKVYGVITSITQTSDTRWQYIYVTEGTSSISSSGTFTIDNSAYANLKYRVLSSAGYGAEDTTAYISGNDLSGTIDSSGYAYVSYTVSRSKTFGSSYFGGFYATSGDVYAVGDTCDMYITETVIVKFQVYN